MLSQALLLVVAALPLITAAPAANPTTTVQRAPDGTADAPRTTHTVVAGRPGLRFDPENIVAEAGSIVEFHFLQLNHSVVEAAFGSPCQPKDASSFFSGFFPVPRNADGSASQSAEVFQIEVRDADTPIWFYCAQNTGRHCQSGMVGVVNQKVDSGNTLEVFRANAAKVQGPSGVLAQVQGGWRGPNPNPLGGF
jgi:plastocyanin